MGDDHNAVEKAEAKKLVEHQCEEAIKRAVYAVKTAIQPFTEDDRKRVLDEALGEVNSGLAARRLRLADNRTSFVPETDQKTRHGMRTDEWRCIENAAEFAGMLTSG
jgi:hypothetical protein